MAGNVMIELPQAGSATTFYGEEQGQSAHMTCIVALVFSASPSLAQMKTVGVMKRC